MAQYSPFDIPTMFSYILIYLVYVHGWVAHVWRSEDNMSQFSLSIIQVLGTQTQVVWFGNQLSHLIEPLRMF